MSSLVTGAGGFVGQWLIRELLDRGEEVTGFTIDTPASIGVLTAEQRTRVKWIDGDVRDANALENALEESSPNAIYHLAGITFVPAGNVDSTVTYDVNSLGAARLLGAVGRRKKARSESPRVLIVGSAEQYGRHDKSESPLSETAEQRPLTVYGASKAAQEIIALQAAAESGLDVIATRSFNHSGRGQDPRFLLPGLVQRIRSLASVVGGRLPIGNTHVTRDFLHVADVVKAYTALIQSGKPGEVYNVSSAKGWTVAEITEVALRIAGVNAETETSPALARPTDIEWLVGDNTRLRQATGWQPTMELEDIVKDLWEG